MHFEAKIISELETVVAGQAIECAALDHAGGARGEVVSFQIACRSRSAAEIALAVDSPLREHLEIREAGFVPCLNPAPSCDAEVVCRAPGLYADPLLPCPQGIITLSNHNWHSYWITVRIPGDFAAGKYPVDFRITDITPPWNTEPERVVHKELARLHLDFTVYGFSLPPQTHKSIQWFYADCIMSRYGVECWSEAHWTLLRKYFRNMAEHGSNVLYTPLWTVPLDTSIGAQRPTVQLLEITHGASGYTFGFGRLKRWIDLAKQEGVGYFELSHIFTQWGARKCPKIVVNGRPQFGWECAADSPQYADFLSQLLPELQDFLLAEGLEHKCFVHISDEPMAEHMESYRKAVTLVKRYLDSRRFTFIDALSSIEFYHRGLVDCPVPSTSHFAPFDLEKGLPQRWFYYTGGDCRDGLPNRTIAHPGYRNRILGVLMYLYRMDGFLHWGYNFWYSRLSEHTDLDPFRDPECGRYSGSGSSFLVYPGADGPVDSLRHEIYREGWQDLRALQLLETRIGREAVVALVHEGVGERITLNCYPREAEWLPELRERVNRILEENG